MTKKRFFNLILAATSFLLTCQSANAELYVLSRANCTPLGINESISWDPEFTQHVLRTYSIHQKLGELDAHHIETPLEATWRSYAGDMWDSGKSKVWGIHQLGGIGSMGYFTTEATDCNLSE